MKIPNPSSALGGMIALSAALLTSSQAVSAAAASSFETPEYYAQEGLQQINAAQAYALGYTGRGVAVALLDSGIAAWHSEFLGQLMGGYDFVLGRPVGPGVGVDGEGHGSHVSGIMAARRDGVGMHGVAFDAGIYSFRMPDTDDGDDDDDFAPAWNLMAEQKLTVINNSLGVNDCPDKPAPCHVVDYTVQSAMEALPATIASMHNVAASGALMVFSAGNEDQPHPDFLAGAPYLFPQLKDSWLAVASVGPDNVITAYSNQCGAARAWCLSAPGGGDDEDTSGIYSVRGEGGYVRFSGTSMASPHVAGAAALVKQAYPYFTASNLQQTILTTATPIGDPDVYGWGMLNVGKAVQGPAQFVDTFDVDTQGHHSTFYNDISGAGQLIKRGAGQLTLVGANTYTGPTVVQAGKLVVDGSQASVVQVAVAGTLGGSGQVGGLDNSGTVTPGNSVGVLTVAGDYISRPGSVYRVEADASGNDQIHVSGTATLTGGAVEIRANERFSVGSRYAIVTAGGGIIGRYDEATTQQGLVFLKPLLDYTQPGSIELAIARSDAAFVDYLGTSNQKAVGRAMDAASTAPPAGLKALYDPILNSTSNTLADSMDQLSGELHASTQSALLNANGLTQRTIGQRMRGNIGAAPALGRSTAQTVGALPAGAMPEPLTPPLWASVVGSWNTLKGNGNAAPVKTDMAGLFVGGDTRVAGGWRVGAALGYTDGRVRVDERSSRSNITSYTGALYGGRSWTANTGSRLNLLAGAAYTRHTIDSRRNVTLGGNQALNADYAAHAAQVFTELGYAMPIGAYSRLEPYIGLAWLSQRSKGFSETGGQAALQSGSHTDRMATFTLGLRGQSSLVVSGMEATVTGGLGWRHAGGDIKPDRRLSFAQADNVAFTVAGAPIAKNSAIVDVGAHLALGKQTVLGLSYGGQFGNASLDHSGSLFLEVKF